MIGFDVARPISFAAQDKPSITRRAALRTLAAGSAACAVAGGMVMIATPPTKAEAIGAELDIAIEQHRVALADMERTGKAQGACERALRLIETPETRSAFRVADDAFNLDCEREGKAHERVIATPIATLADMRAKAAYLASVSRHMIHDDSTMAALLASMGASTTASVAVGSAPPDPMLELDAAYRKGLQDFNAAHTPTPEAEDAAALATFRPHYDRLCIAPPIPSTMAGAIAAVRLVADEEEMCGHREEFTINTLRAALAFFDRRS